MKDSLHSYQNMYNQSRLVNIEEITDVCVMIHKLYQFLVSSMYHCTLD